MATPTARAPTLRRHTTGVYFCQWGGRQRYFTKNLAESRRLFDDSLIEWAEFNARRPVRPPARGQITVAQLTRLFLEAKFTDAGEGAERYFRLHLRRFVNLWGALPATFMNGEGLQNLKTDMKRMGFAAATINHDIGAVKGLYRWGSDFEHIPEINLRGVRKCKLAAPRDKSIPIEQIRMMITRAKEGRVAEDGEKIDPEPRLVPWLHLNYLALMRPIEVPRLVHRRGRFIEKGIFELEKGKSEEVSGTPRCIVLSDEALMWLDAARPVWSDLDSYSAAVRRVCGPGGPHRLRHSGATHLGREGVARADIDLILGHMPPRVSLIYNPVAWQPLRASAARLKL